MFLRVFPTGRNGGVESPQDEVLPLAETLFILLVDSPNQILILILIQLNNDFQVITQSKLHLWL